MAVEQHKHCPVCGSPIPMDERVCSPDCEKILTQREKQIKKSRTILYVVMVIFIIVLAWFAFFR